MTIFHTRASGRGRFATFRRAGLVAGLVAGVLTSATHAPALAADMLADAPESVTQVEYGTGWYLRGEIGFNYNQDKFSGVYTTSDPVFLLDESADTDNLWNYGIAVGYQLTNNLRADLSLEHFAESTTTGTGVQRVATTNCGGATHPALAPSSVCSFSGSASHKIIGSFASAYYDFGNNALGLTPFVGAGVGVLRNSYETNAHLVTDATTNQEIATQQDGTSYHLAAALTAGVSYALTDNLSLDTSYRYAHMFEEPLTGGPAHPAGADIPNSFHTVKIGLRYELW